MSTPDFISPLSGFKAFKVDSGFKLASPYQGVAWNPGVNQACCQIQDLPGRHHGFREMGRGRIELEAHRAPHHDCSCGIYAYKSFDKALQEAGGVPGSYWVWGEIELWGRVEEYQEGYRAEYARLLKLAASPYLERLKIIEGAKRDIDIRKTLEVIAREHRIPLVNFYELKKARITP